MALPKVQKDMQLILLLNRQRMIEVLWQDADSSSSKAFRIHYPDEDKSKVMLCGGHVARAHIKLLGEVAKKKSFSETKKDYLKKEFPDVTKV